MYANQDDNQMNRARSPAQILSLMELGCVTLPAFRCHHQPGRSSNLFAQELNFQPIPLQSSTLLIILVTDIILMLLRGSRLSHLISINACVLKGLFFS